MAASENCMNLVGELAGLNLKLSDKLKDDRKTLASLQSEISDILHIIEYLDLPAHKLAGVMKKLKDFYRQRRVLKEDIIMLQNILESKKPAAGELTSSVERTARYKTESETRYKRIFTCSLPK